MPSRAPAGLHYVCDDEPGIRRVRAGKGFAYRRGARNVRDAKTLTRIKRLAIPPAWTDVWICADPLGHLQATGRDARGRKQHRYHARYRAVRDEAKFAHMAEFAKALPAIRARVGRDMAKPGAPREKVLAAIVKLLDATLIRIGNDEYARANKSYGLTTLKDAHAKVNGDTLKFIFKGKSGKEWRLSLKHKRVARIVKQAQDLPGQRLFQYRDAGGEIAHVTSNDVNAYLREASGRDITAKDFRTWGATVLAAAELARLAGGDNKLTAKANVKAAIDAVAATLGNTPTICRKSYVHPRLVERYLDGDFALPKAKRNGLSPHEASVSRFLTQKTRATSAR